MTDTSRVYVRLINDSYELRINDKIIHKGNLKKIPHITAVCTVDKASNQLITKAVNISDLRREFYVDNVRGSGIIYYLLP